MPKEKFMVESKPETVVDNSKEQKENPPVEAKQEVKADEKPVATLSADELLDKLNQVSKDKLEVEKQLTEVKAFAEAKKAAADKAYREANEAKKTKEQLIQELVSTREKLGAFEKKETDAIAQKNNDYNSFIEKSSDNVKAFVNTINSSGKLGPDEIYKAIADAEQKGFLSLKTAAVVDGSRAVRQSINVPAEAKKDIAHQLTRSHKGLASMITDGRASAPPNTKT